MVNGDKKLLTHCFNLDGIVFMEIMKEQQCWIYTLQLHLR
jgi:hypothetical protein